MGMNGKHKYNLAGTWCVLLTPLKIIPVMPTRPRLPPAPLHFSSF